MGKLLHFFHQKELYGKNNPIVFLHLLQNLFLKLTFGKIDKFIKKCR